MSETQTLLAPTRSQGLTAWWNEDQRNEKGDRGGKLVESAEYDKIILRVVRNHPSGAHMASLCIFMCRSGQRHWGAERYKFLQAGSMCHEANPPTRITP